MPQARLTTATSEPATIRASHSLNRGQAIASPIAPCLNESCS